jgi:hypothetical protein
MDTVYAAFKAQVETIGRAVEVLNTVEGDVYIANPGVFLAYWNEHGSQTFGEKFCKIIVDNIVSGTHLPIELEKCTGKVMPEHVQFKLTIGYKDYNMEFTGKMDGLNGKYKVHYQGKRASIWKSMFREEMQPEECVENMMADDCTASILESLHQRVMKLEDVWKVEYEIGDARQPLEMLLTGTKFSHKNTLFPAIKSTGNKIYGEIWTNPLDNFKKVGNVYRVEIGDEIMVRDTSNGADCLLVVTKGKINDTNVVLKFRLVDYKSENMTEVEARHALSTSLNKDMHGLFPELYAVMKITTGINVYPALTIIPGAVRPPPVIAKKQMVWECIATEPLEELTVQDVSNVKVQAECFKLLRILHTKGFVHGDPHMGNFMKKKVGEGQHLVYMIDQDEIRKLPVADRAMSLFMQILDYQTFATWNNPFFTAFDVIKKERGTMWDIVKAWNKVSLHFKYRVILFTPQPFWSYKGLDSKAMRAKLPPEYIANLSKDNVNGKHIYELFVELIENMKQMDKANTVLLDAWRNKLSQTRVRLPDPPPA